MTFHNVQTRPTQPGYDPEFWVLHPSAVGWENVCGGGGGCVGVGENLKQNEIDCGRNQPAESLAGQTHTVIYDIQDLSLCNPADDRGHPNHSS